MKGLIKREDIVAVRERANLEEIVSEHVSLRSAGLGSMKGLCPFHDEKTPSFNIRPAIGRYHCFGCGEGGDVIEFVQKINHMSFTEAVEYLASRYGIQLRYEESFSRGDRDGGPRTDFGTRQRLLAAHEVAEEFFREHLTSPEAEIGRRFLAERDFGPRAAAHFGIGFAPQGWDNLTRHLRSRGFTEKELTLSGLVSDGQRGVYDRFRGRLVWPIRDVTGKTIGFGARRLFEDDKGPKYLNTPETPIYKKSQVLYGLDLARKHISAKRQVVVMEGYTDVMAAHAAGIDTAVASCGTAFGSEHVTLVRRIMGDTSALSSLSLASGGGSFAGAGGEVIFTFDGDEAGQNAALKAFREDQRFVAQTYVAVDPQGMDPCDIRVKRGEEALKDVIAARIPMFEFAIRAALRSVDLDTAEGQIAGLRMAAPVVAQIRDHALRPEYARRLSGWLGLDERTVQRAVQDAGKAVYEQRRIAQQASEYAPESPGAGGSDATHAPTDAEPLLSPIRLRDITQTHDPIETAEVQALSLLLQAPSCVSIEDVHALPDEPFRTVTLQSVWDCVIATGLFEEAADKNVSVRAFVEAVMEIAGDSLRPLIGDLASYPLPARDEQQLNRLGPALIRRLQQLSFTHDISELRRKLGRLTPDRDAEEYRATMNALQEAQQKLRALKD
ncbi:DNA primase [Dermabacter hominis]|uniref:DNA primase n=1 Tax=Dermabacter hominis TaxID=36740 RepID=UPI000C759B0B|nr:DNA primase [Dermabacter hominis]WIK60992.1 DNA primase [Dermabacter hominis]